jgi:hypothetical protein
MIRLRDPGDLPLVQDLEIRALIAQRFEDFAQGEPYDPELHARPFLAQDGDTREAIETATGCCITPERFDVLEEHDTCFELVFAEGDAGTVIFIPKAADTDADLITFCRAYAEPAPDLKAA